MTAKCSFSHPGTYNHECGKAAPYAAAFQSDNVEGGIFYTPRCEKCAKIKGGENIGLLSLEPFDTAKHKNKWRTK